MQDSDFPRFVVCNDLLSKVTPITDSERI